MTTIRPSLDAAARAALAARVEARLRTAGAVAEGHVRLADGRHSPIGLDLTRALADPAIVAELAAAMAVGLRRPDGPAVVDAVVAADPEAVALADETARLLLARAAGPEAVGRGERVLVVGGADAPGDRLAGRIEAVEAAGGEVVGCRLVVDRLGDRATVVSPRSGRRVPLVALWTPASASVSAGTGSCPGCAAGLPLEG